ARPRLHDVPLPRDAHEPARRRLGRREHVVPGVQGRRGRRAPDRGAAREGAGARGRSVSGPAGAPGDDAPPDRARAVPTPHPADAAPSSPAAHMVASVVRDGGVRDEVAVEEPLEIRVDGEPLTVTMRTPGHDEELALGFLHGEGLIAGAAPAPAASPTADLAANVVEVAGPLLRDAGARHFYTTSSCGVCGKGALEEVAVAAPVAAPGPRVAR